MFVYSAPPEIPDSAAAPDGAPALDLNESGLNVEPLPNLGGNNDNDGDGDGDKKDDDHNDPVALRVISLSDSGGALRCETSTNCHHRSFVHCSFRT